MAREQLLPGVVPKPIKELHDACEDLFDAREKVAKARKVVNERQAHIGKILRKHKLETYNLGGVKAEILESERVVVERTAKQEAKAS